MPARKGIEIIGGKGNLPKKVVLRADIAEAVHRVKDIYPTATAVELEHDGDSTRVSPVFDEEHGGMWVPLDVMQLVTHGKSKAVVTYHGVRYHITDVALVFSASEVGGFKWCNVDLVRLAGHACRTHLPVDASSENSWLVIETPLGPKVVVKSSVFSPVDTTRNLGNKDYPDVAFMGGWSVTPRYVIVGRIKKDAPHTHQRFTLGQYEDGMTITDPFATPTHPLTNGRTLGT